ncbi:MAG: hypothetical protein GY867_04135 [bacterium]|nr:hypothetical protein [bacterium]
MRLSGSDMKGHDRRRKSDGLGTSRPAHLVRHLRELLASVDDPREVFFEFSRILEQGFPIRKGLLALRGKNETRFLAVASWGTEKGRRNLSLRLPTVSSLFEKVAEDGRGYVDNSAVLFDGNQIERRLLLAEDTQSFVLRPVKYDGCIVALLGYSSDRADAFAALEESVLNQVMESFGELIGKHLANTTVALTAP